MMLLGPNRKPDNDKIKQFLEQISMSVDMNKKDREYIMALEEKIIQQRSKEEAESRKQRRLYEHKRIQQLLDSEVIKVTDLMKEEVKQFKLARVVKSEKVVPMARCPSPSPVLGTPIFKKRKSIFLTRDFFANMFKKQDDNKDDDEEGKEDMSDDELIYTNAALEEMSYATKVDQLYGLAEKLVYVTDEGCKDIAAKLRI